MRYDYKRWIKYLTNLHGTVIKIETRLADRAPCVRGSWTVGGRGGNLLLSRWGWGTVGGPRQLAHHIRLDNKHGLNTVHGIAMPRPIAASDIASAASYRRMARRYKAHRLGLKNTQTTHSRGKSTYHIITAMTLRSQTTKRKKLISTVFNKSTAFA